MLQIKINIILCRVIMVRLAKLCEAIVRLVLSCYRITPIFSFLLSTHMLVQLNSIACTHFFKVHYASPHPKVIIVHRYIARFICIEQNYMQPAVTGVLSTQNLIKFQEFSQSETKLVCNHTWYTKKNWFTFPLISYEGLLD